MISFPWDSQEIGFNEETGFPIYDRGYKAQELREVFKAVFSNGVFDVDPPAFTTTAGEGMSVLVSAGRCFIEGDIGVEIATRELVLQAASSQDRIDTIVLRWDNNIETRSIDLYVVQGVASATPVRPTLTRGETVYELGICDIFIPKNSTSVSNDRITDTRLETARCGIATPFDTIDTTTFYNQIQAAIDAHIATLDEQTQTAVDLAQSALDGTIAGNLQTQIDGINETISSVKESVEFYIPSEAPEPEWVSHRNVYRGKYLGDEYTDEQKQAISSGTFDDLYVGDYWTIGGFDWVIADINYWIGTGNDADKIGVSENHLVVVPRTHLYNSKMNDTMTTTGGYAGSKMRTTYLNNAKTIIYAAFGENKILNHKELLLNSVGSDGLPNGTAWFDSKVDLMNQNMVIGSMPYNNYINATTTPSNDTIDKVQLALFRSNQNLIDSGSFDYWLRDVVTSKSFVFMNWAGAIKHYTSENTLGVRPAFGLIG